MKTKETEELLNALGGKAEMQYLPIKDLIPAEYNPREITEEQFEQLKASIHRFGFVEPVLVNINPERKNIIVGGHMRTRAAKELGYEDAPCILIDLTREQERELNIRLNKNTGKFDHELLANFFDAEELIDWGFTEKELDFFQDMPEDTFEDTSGEENEINYQEQYGVIVMCADELDQEATFNKLQGEGYQCKIVAT